MATLTDARFNSLRTQGFTGATSDMLLKWLQANGATAKAVPDAWREMLLNQVPTNPNFYHRNDRWYNYLDSIAPAEIPRQLNSLELWFWKPVLDGGLGGVLPAPVPLDSIIHENGLDNLVAENGLDNLVVDYNLE